MHVKVGGREGEGERGRGHMVGSLGGRGREGEREEKKERGGKGG